MNWDKIFTKEQFKRLDRIKNPTITKIIQLSDELNIDMLTIFRFYANKNSKISKFEK